MIDVQLNKISIEFIHLFPYQTLIVCLEFEY